MTQDIRAVQKASTEAQARVKRDNALHDFAVWNAKADQLKRCVDMATNHLEKVVFQKHLSSHLKSAIAQGEPHEQ